MNSSIRLSPRRVAGGRSGLQSPHGVVAVQPPGHWPGAKTDVVERRGAAMVYVLILLLVISMIGGTLVRGAIASHRQRMKDEIHAQTVRLAEAGWNRALRQVAKSPDYKEETWAPDADSLGPDRKASVRIEVSAESDANRLTVSAEYPLDHPNRNRVTLSGLINPQAP